MTSREGTSVGGPLPVPFMSICSLGFPEKRSTEAHEERDLRHDFMEDILLEMKDFI